MTDTTSRPGRKKQFGPREEIHLKFDAEAMEFINANADEAGGYQAFFSQLVQQASNEASVSADIDHLIAEATTTHNLPGYINSILILGLTKIMPLVSRHMEKQIAKLIASAADSLTRKTEK
jgi:hypothetical protein